MSDRHEGSKHRDQRGSETAGSEELLDNVGTAFSKLRRRTMSVPVDPPVARTDLRRDLLLNAVEEGDGELSVTGLAAVLMIDRPAASRLVSSCVDGGLVERVASQGDGRITSVRLTSDGRRTLAHSRSQQRQAFEYITRDWSVEDRVELARLLHRYVDSTASPDRPDSHEPRERS